MNHFLLFCYILLVLIYDYFSVYLKVSILDEVFILGIFTYASLIYSKNKLKLLPFDKKILNSFYLLILLGSIGSLLSNLQPTSIQIMDLIIFSKFFIAYFAIRIILTYHKTKYSIKKKTLYFLFFTVVLLLLLIILNRIENFFPYFDYKFHGFGSEELFFGHPAKLAFMSQITLIMLLPFLKKNNFIIIVLFLTTFLGFFTFRTKFFIFMAFFFSAIFFMKIFNLKYISRKKLFFIFLFFLIFIGSIAHQDILFHLFNENGVRGLLLVNAFDISINYFPLGSGFGSYGSYASTVNYSPLYYTYGFDLIPGCFPEKPSFLVDNFYAMLLAEFGIIGIILFLYIMFQYLIFFIYAFNHDYINRYYYIGPILLIIIILLESLSSTLLTQNNGIFMAVYLAFIVSKFHNNKESIDAK